LRVVSEGVSMEGDALKFPRKAVLFMPEINNEFNVIDLIEADSDISRSDIEFAYNKWVDSVRNNLRDGTLEIEGVGVILQYSDSDYEVKLTDELNSILNPYDRDSVKVVKISGQQKKKPHKKHKKWPLVLAFVILIVGAGAYAVYYYDLSPWGKNAEESETEIQFKEAAPPVTMPEETVIDSVTLMRDTIPSASVEEQILQEIVNDAAQFIKEEYHVIAGVFSTEENARRFIKMNSAQNAKVIPRTNTFMVSVGTFYNEQDARDGLKEIQKTFPEVWIYKSK